MLNIAVCVKQVPARDEVLMDPQTGNLMRDGTDARINPCDLVAIEAALQLKEKCGGNVTALSMGPRSAKEVLYTSLSMGVNEGILLSDPKFAGADVYATSFALAQGLSIGCKYDVIICGRQTSDGDTGQVGPSIGEQLGIPHVFGVIAVEKIEPEYLVVTQIMDKNRVCVKVQLPCVLIVAKEAYCPRLPSLKLKLEAKKKDIRIVTFDDLGTWDPKCFGFDGSPTHVEKIFLPEKSRREAVRCIDADAQVELMLDRLKGLSKAETRV